MPAVHLGTIFCVHRLGLLVNHEAVSVEGLVFLDNLIFR